MPLFDIGTVRITPSALLVLEGSPDSPEWEGLKLLSRHASGDWGEVSKGNARENELSVGEGYRVLSAYVTRSGHRVWIITHADRRATIILLPEEY